MTRTTRSTGAIDRVLAATSKPPSAVEDFALLEAHLFHAKALFSSVLERMGEDAATGGVELSEDLGELAAELGEHQRTIETVFDGVRSLRIRHAATVAHGDADLLASIVELRTTREAPSSAPNGWTDAERDPLDFIQIGPSAEELEHAHRFNPCRCSGACSCTARFVAGGAQ